MSVDRFAVLRAGYGALLLAAPDPVIRLYTGHRAHRLTRAVARTLGSRHLIQAIVTSGKRGALVPALGVEVDAAHAVSMLGLAMIDQRGRRAGLVDVAAAGAFRTARCWPGGPRCWQTAQTTPAAGTSPSGKAPPPG